ncbi:MAG: protein kinase [Cyanobacteria bacterium NC_groundwater_1444_Ag_S-0.65um_54_12]|nr:protein kinase [Cyanobacteria bacterium NC_groundwater_1444_Ag_S-0.65um_54_12]
MGETLGKYEIIEELGRGGMGVVYRALDTCLNREVALKELMLAVTLPTAEKIDTVERFKREGVAAARLQHPNIVSIYETGNDGERYFMAMELVSGKSLGYFLDKKTIFSCQQVVDIGVQICSALDYAHQSGIVHRDIKPDNIHIEDNGRVKLMDFGVARIKSDLPDLTQTGTTLGTIAYISPEQLTDSRQVDGRSDIFSLGALFYEMLTFRTPFDAGNLGGTILRIMNESPTPPQEINPNIPNKLANVILRALRKNPEDRFPRAAEMLYALQDALRIETGATSTIVVPRLESCRFCRSTLPLNTRVCPNCGRSNIGGGLAAEKPPAVLVPSRPQLSPPRLSPTATMSHRPQLPLSTARGTQSASKGNSSPGLNAPAKRAGANSPANDLSGVAGAVAGQVKSLAFSQIFGKGGPGHGEFTQARGIAFDNQDRLYVADTENGRVQIFDIQGRFINQIKASPNKECFRFPRSVAISVQGIVYITDDLDYRIYKFATDGQPLGIWRRVRAGDVQPTIPSRILVALQGIIYLAEPNNRRVLLFDINENPLGIISEGLTAPCGLALDADGQLFVIDAANAMVNVYNNARKLKMSFGQKGTGPGEFSVPRDVVVDNFANIYVADTLNHRIQVFDASGKHVLSLGQKGTKINEFNGPEGLLIGPDDRLYVADRGNGRVQVFHIARGNG